MYKKTIIGILIVVIVGGVVSQTGTEEVFTKIETEVIKEVTPEWATDEDAVKAAQDVVRKKALEAELKALQASFASSTAAFEAEKESFLKREVELEKEIGVY